MTDPTLYLPEPQDQVRLLIADIDPTRRVFTDGDVLGFLAIEGGSVKRAAAAALDTIGTSELLVSKVIRTQDLQTDGAKVAAELRARAAALRGQADAADQAALAADGEFFDVIAGPPVGVELTERWR